jgi:hypothetical protein
MPEPPEVQTTVRVTKSVQLSVTSLDAGAPVTVADIAAAVPGGSTYWSRIRVQSVRVWGQSGTSTGSSPAELKALTVATALHSGAGDPVVSWTDQGTLGQRRPFVGFQFGLLEQAHWYGTADTAVLATIVGGYQVGSTNGPVIVQAVIELLSPA